MSNLATWKQSWQALDEQMKMMETTCELGVLQGKARMQTLLRLVKCLRVFAAGQFHFFYQGFDTNALNLATHPDYPVDYVMRGVIYQIENDIEAIQKAITQRDVGTSKMKSTLALTDQLAFDALKPALHGTPPIITDTPTVITYFQKFASIRLIPYAPVALVGIPFSCTENSKDLLAVPHEIGHYVFRHGANSNGTFRKQLDDYLNTLQPSPKYNRKWMEEVFADAYGCLVAGAAMALDFQDLQIEKSPDDFIDDDGEHPAPLLRPYLYTAVLSYISASWSDKLRVLWDARRQAQNASGSESFTTVDRRNKTIQVIHYLSAFDSTNINANLPVNHTLRKALELLPDANLAHWNEAAWWTQIRNIQLTPAISTLTFTNLDTDTSAIQDFIYQDLQDKITGQNIPSHDIPELTGSCDTSDLDDVGKRQTFIDTLVVSWPSPFFTVNSPQDNWDKVWVANGWQTSGNGQWIQT
ncbi:MAG: hypothetical protein KC445_06360 [Anaerolineales bacterium]|nr:hypothetical protein [Anaerolineales bacterium]